MSASVSSRVADLLTAHGQGHLLQCLPTADQAYADSISGLDPALLASLFRGENLAPAPDLSALEPPPVAPAGNDPAARAAMEERIPMGYIAGPDEVASAAELVMGKSSGVPVAVVRGVDPTWFRESSMSEIVRPPQEDLFR